jgi:hypothetical protein
MYQLQRSFSVEQREKMKYSGQLVELGRKLLLNSPAQSIFRQSVSDRSISGRSLRPRYFKVSSIDKNMAPVTDA